MGHETNLHMQPLRWVVSTNKPDHNVALVYVFGGVLSIVQWLYLLQPNSWASFTPPTEFVLAVFLGTGLASFLTAAFLFRESRVHAEAFPKGSQCSLHSEELAYDRCAICGQLFCEKCLVRIKPKWYRTIGFFRFNGVACKACAYRQVKWCLLFGLSFWLIFLTPLLLFLNLNPMLLYSHLNPTQAAEAARVATLTGVVLASMVTLGWYFQGKTQVMPSLSKQPEEILDIETRIVDIS
jgi:hypothetical protein